MATSRIVKLDLNRVEGDLEVNIQFDGRQVTDAWCVGTMFRGFEQILMGRAAMDSLAITPRICGICGTAHLYAAVTALETTGQCAIAPNGTRVRNLCLMAEEVQSDPRHTFLMFNIDFCNPRYQGHADYDDVLKLFEPFKGRIYRETIQHTKEVLKIVAILGGQWPHSSYMVPGGVTNVPSIADLVRVHSIIDAYAKWYEDSILCCSTDRWLSVKCLDDLLAWHEETPAHRDSPVGLFTRFGRSIKLHQTGKGSGNLLSYGGFFDADRWQPPFQQRHCLRASGFYNAQTGAIEPLDHKLIEEHVKYSYFVDYEGGRHPWQGETIPDHDPAGEKYSWAKAPRYQGKVVEVGALADLVMAGDPLATALFKEEGSNTWLRQFVRLHRPVLTLLEMKKVIQELLERAGEPYIEQPGSIDQGQGAGLVSAARGTLAHWVQLTDGQIDRYQVITPTA